MSDDQFNHEFAKALNSHGYGFQYRVIKEVEECDSIWSPVVPEFPVEARGHETRIDVILKGTRRSLYIVAECKRVNPALSQWCFVQSPPTLNVALPSIAVMETAQIGDDGKIRTNPTMIS